MYIAVARTCANAGGTSPVCTAANSAAILGTGTPASCFQTVPNTAVADGPSTCSGLLFGSGTMVTIDTATVTTLATASNPVTTPINVGAAVLSGLECLYGRK